MTTTLGVYKPRGLTPYGWRKQQELRATLARQNLAGRAFDLRPARVEDVDLGPGSADAVLAMGSLQYAADFEAAVARCASWLRPGGVLCMLADSLHALVIELLAAGRAAEAMERLNTRRGVWRVDGHIAEMHLADRSALEAATAAAGVHVTRVAGLLVGASVHGRDRLHERLTADYAGQLGRERMLAARPELADLGKQLLIVGIRPVPSAR